MEANRSKNTNPGYLVGVREGMGAGIRPALEAPAPGESPSMGRVVVPLLLQGSQPGRLPLGLSYARGVAWLLKSSATSQTHRSTRAPPSF